VEEQYGKFKIYSTVTDKQLWELSWTSKPSRLYK